MNLDEFYRSISNFWDIIAPILFAHIIALIVIRWIAGVRWHLLDQMESFLNTERYKKWKGVLDEFELRPKLPYLLVICVIIYFVLFNSLLLDTLADFSPITITYSENDFWDESRPLDDIADIGSYSNNPQIHVWEILSLKQNYLQDYQTRYPDHYRSLVTWLSEAYGKRQTYYKCSVIFLLFALILSIFHLCKTPHRSLSSFMRVFALLIFSVLSIAFTRYESEKYIEKQLRAELSFVSTQLSIDAQAQQNRLNGEGIKQLKRNLYEELKHTDQRSRYTFWWSRILERFHIGKREFPHISDEAFRQRYRYLEEHPENTMRQ